MTQIATISSSNIKRERFRLISERLTAFGNTNKLVLEILKYSSKIHFKNKNESQFIFIDKNDYQAVQQFNYIKRKLRHLMIFNINNNVSKNIINNIELRISKNNEVILNSLEKDSNTVLLLIQGEAYYYYDENSITHNGIISGPDITEDISKNEDVYFFPDKLEYMNKLKKIPEKLISKGVAIYSIISKLKIQEYIEESKSSEYNLFFIEQMKKNFPEIEYWLKTTFDIVFPKFDLIEYKYGDELNNDSMDNILFLLKGEIELSINLENFDNSIINNLNNIDDISKNTSKSFKIESYDCEDVKDKEITDVVKSIYAKNSKTLEFKVYQHYVGLNLKQTIKQNRKRKMKSFEVEKELQKHNLDEIYHFNSINYNNQNNTNNQNLNNIKKNDNIWKTNIIFTGTDWINIDNFLYKSLDINNTQVKYTIKSKNVLIKKIPLFDFKNYFYLNLSRKGQLLIKSIITKKFAYYKLKYDEVLEKLSLNNKKKSTLKISERFYNKIFNFNPNLKISQAVKKYSNLNVDDKTKIDHRPQTAIISKDNANKTLLLEKIQNSNIYSKFKATVNSSSMNFISIFSPNELETVKNQIERENNILKSNNKQHNKTQSLILSHQTDKFIDTKQLKSVIKLTRKKNLSLVKNMTTEYENIKKDSPEVIKKRIDKFAYRMISKIKSTNSTFNIKNILISKNENKAIQVNNNQDTLITQREFTKFSNSDQNPKKTISFSYKFHSNSNQITKY